MLSWSDADLESLLEPDTVMVAIREAFARTYESVRMPHRLQLDVGFAIMLIMPCAIAGDPVCGMKIVRVSRHPRPEGRVTASYIVFDTTSGQIIAVMAANYLTDLRTAATSAIATQVLASGKGTTLGIFGTGRQAQAHIRIFSRCRRFGRILVCGSSLEKANSFATQMRTQYKADITPADATTCASTSDVICTCTNSVEPLFPGELVRPGTHLNLVGTFQAHAREVDSVLIPRSRIFVDTYEGALAEAGDILAPLHAGEIQAEHVKGDLHELVTGSKPGRTSENDITIFKSVGCALEDLVTAKLVLASTENTAANC
jgi:ornithine cyclodeaminase/alanine dehydrogenase-like protein (mu-crystallin family)